jgi:hypothetical protein
MGIVTSAILTQKFIKNKISTNDPLSKAVIKEYRSVSSSTPLNELGRVLAK